MSKDSQTTEIVKDFGIAETVIKIVSTLVKDIVIPAYQEYQKSHKDDQEEKRKEPLDNIKVFKNFLEQVGDLTKYTSFDDFEKRREVREFELSSQFKRDLFNEKREQQKQQKSIPPKSVSDSKVSDPNKIAIENFEYYLKKFNIFTDQDYEGFKESDSYKKSLLDNYAKSRIFKNHQDKYRKNTKELEMIKGWSTDDSGLGERSLSLPITTVNSTLFPPYRPTVPSIEIKAKPLLSIAKPIQMSTASLPRISSLSTTVVDEKKFATEAYEEAKTFHNKGMYADARKNYEIAWAAGITKAGNKLATLLIRGDGGAQEVERAINIYEQLGKSGDVVAMENLSKVYQKGEDVAKNSKKAAYWKNLHDQAVRPSSSSVQTPTSCRGRGSSALFVTGDQLTSKISRTNSTVAPVSLTVGLLGATK